LEPDLSLSKESIARSFCGKQILNLKTNNMKTIKEQLLLIKDDYQIIMSYLKKGLARASFNREEAENLENELKKAKLVNKDQMPADVVRLNSSVTFKDEKDNKVMEVMLVTPEKVNIKQRKISIMSPIGTALIGFKKGQQVRWMVPAGKKTFTILDVVNPI
jgi:regulator of nucleoside diphosphate kinase